jgi:uncharacterized protein (TIGR02646 family)
MRQIQKRNEPQRLTRWRAANQTDRNFGYALMDTGLRAEVRQALVAEQGELCAYSGRKIGNATCHIEHLKPQEHCARGEDVAYGNMVACVPAPNAPGLRYGAHKKASWPSAAQEALFVSPLRAGCGARFSFNLRGEITPSSPADGAATETIMRLGLDHPQLNQLRKAAIDSTLASRQRGPAALDARRARQRIASLKAAEQVQGPLEPFCFVLLQALEKQVRRLAAIRQSQGAQA